MRRLIALLLVLAFQLSFTLVLPPLTQAYHGRTSYQYIIGVEPTEGPVISRAENGDTIEMTGEGNITVNPAMVTGGGDIIHKDADGNVIGQGTWEAVRLVSFESWGTSEDFHPNFEGGKALLRIRLHPEGLPTTYDALLWVVCLIGNIPPGSEEGIELFIPRAGFEFDEELHGETLFIRQ